MRDLLITGAVLHDIGKIQEFEVSSCGMVKDYTVKAGSSHFSAETERHEPSNIRSKIKHEIFFIFLLLSLRYRLFL